MGTRIIQKHPELPHVGYVDLDDNHVAVEVVVMKQDKSNGDLYYIKTEDMDAIDRRRLETILKKRDATKYPLWDLLDNTVLGNGENALEFFHQMVKVKTAGGQTLVPGHGRKGIALGPDPDTQRRGPGRPPNS